jgi:hypothetical protein
LTIIARVGNYDTKLFATFVDGQQQKWLGRPIPKPEIYYFMYRNVIERNVEDINRV